MTQVSLDQLCLETDAPDQWPDVHLTSNVPEYITRCWNARRTDRVAATETTEPWMVYHGYRALYEIRQQAGLDEGLDYLAFQHCINRNALVSLGIVSPS